MADVDNRPIVDGVQIIHVEYQRGPGNSVSIEIESGPTTIPIDVEHRNRRHVRAERAHGRAAKEFDAKRVHDGIAEEIHGGFPGAPDQEDPEQMSLRKIVYYRQNPFRVTVEDWPEDQAVSVQSIRRALDE